MDKPADSSKVALNRSFSFSGSPITQKVSVEQSFQNREGETLIRQYSCEQIYDRSRSAVHCKEVVVIHGPKRLGPKAAKFFIPLFQSDRSVNPSSSSRLSNSSQLRSLSGLANPSELYNSSTANLDSDIKQFPFNSSANCFGFSKPCPEQKGFEKSLMQAKVEKEPENECTPMEVDVSNSSECMSDVHSSPGGVQGEGFEHRSKVSKLLLPPGQEVDSRASDPAKTSYSFRQTFVKFLKLFAIFIIPVTCALVLIQTDIFTPDDSFISDEFNARNITDALQDLLYGQPEVVTKLKETLSPFEDQQIFVFIGGVGVGKTYTAQIIANNFQWRSNIIKIVSPQFKNAYHETKFVKSLSQNGYNLVVVDGLEITDYQAVISFAKKLLETDKKLILILIFNIQDSRPDLIQPNLNSHMDNLNSVSSLSAVLKKSGLKHTLVSFEQLSKDVVRQCIRYAMAKRGLIINENNIEHVLQNINYVVTGCKNVYSKVALLR